jgi:hypothetical protein
MQFARNPPGTAIPVKELPLIIKLHEYRSFSAADKVATGGHNDSAFYFEQGMHT